MSVPECESYKNRKVVSLIFTLCTKAANMCPSKYQYQVMLHRDDSHDNHLQFLWSKFVLPHLLCSTANLVEFSGRKPDGNLNGSLCWTATHTKHRAQVYPCSLCYSVSCYHNKSLAITTERKICCSSSLVYFSWAYGKAEPHCRKHIMKPRSSPHGAQEVKERNRKWLGA